MRRTLWAGRAEILRCVRVKKYSPGVVHTVVDARIEGFLALDSSNVWIGLSWIQDSSLVSARGICAASAWLSHLVTRVAKGESSMERETDR